MTQKLHFSFLLFLVAISFHLLADKKDENGIIIVPVADLIGHAFANHYTATQIDEKYNNIPFSGNSKGCLRLHQALFNEQVQILDERDREVKIKISSFYYLLGNDATPQTIFWTLKRNVITFKQLKDRKIDTSKFPKPIQYNLNSFDDINRNTVTLKKPFYDPITKKHYSVGTRFITHSSSVNDSFVKVYIFDKNRVQFRTTKIPRFSCVKTTYKNNNEKIKMFVRILRNWSNAKIGFIPYVLGGCSWTIPCTQDSFGSNREKDSKNKPVYYYSRKEWKGTPKTGLDCSGMIGRAAQICGIPYFFKNTTTLVKELQPLKKSDTLQEGDLIWMKGHVMVVSNLEKNTIIESRGYGNGWGKMIEHPINQIFKEVNTFKELKFIFFQHKPVTLLNKNGSVSKVYSNFKILKLESVFENNPFL